LENLLIVLGSAAALGGLAWLGFVGSVMRGSKGNALVGGISSVVIGIAIIFLGISISESDGSVPVQQFASDPLAFATATAEPEGTPTPEISPEELYKQGVNGIALQVSSDLGRVIRLLNSPNVENIIWVNDIRQTSAALARYSARADDLAIPAGQEELQETLTNVLNDLARAGRLVINSLDAVGFQNVSVAQQDVLEARDILSVASPIIVDIVSQTADERE
jgi:hypothetical protein